MKAFVLWCFAAFWPMSAFAGNIFGSLTESKQPIKGASVTVTCGSENYEGGTDADGAYSVRAEATGRCTFSVNYKDQTVETEVFSYNQPTRYDFDLVMEGGKYVLKKK